jgi:hypothetical protein
MSPCLRNAGLVAVVVVLLAICSACQGIAWTGSGGLGAVSFDIEVLLKLVLVTAGVGAIIYWHSRRT